MITMELLLVSVLRALVEVAGMCLLGQGLVYILAGSRRESNPVFQLFRIITRPVVSVVRRLTPKMIVDRHIPLVTFFILLWLWLLLAYVRQIICQGGAAGCPT